MLLKKTLLTTILAVFLWMFTFARIVPSITSARQAPNFDIIFETKDKDGEQSWLWTIDKKWWISADKTLRENVAILFSPLNPNSQLRAVIRSLSVWLIVLFLARAGIDYITHPNDSAKIKEASKSLLYILLGAFLIFAVSWILSTLLRIDDWMTSAWWTLVTNITWWLFFTILSFLKWAAFFLAIIMMVVYGFQMIGSMDKEERATKARKGITNVLLALVFIKVIDFIFFIAQDATFGSQLKSFLFTAAKILWWAMWGIMVLVIIYAWFKYVSAQWDESKAKDAQKMVTKVFYAVLIVFMFLLVTRQIIDAFTKD